MKFILLPVLCLICLCCTTEKKQEASKVDTKKGYKDLVLDATVDSLKAVVPMRLTYVNICNWTRKFEIDVERYHQIGSVRFDKIEMEFVRDSLYRTTLYRKNDFEPLSELQAIYRQEFGEPVERKTDNATYTEWNGKGKYITFTNSASKSEFTIEYGSFKGMHRHFEEEDACSKLKIEKGRSEL